MNLRKKYRIPDNAIITIAGTVGVGKSTMTKALAKALNFRTSLEKVDTNPYLDKFYANFERWSFHLQIYFLAERFKEQKRMFEYGGGFVQDRSIYEDAHIFAKMHFENGTMTVDAPVCSTAPVFVQFSQMKYRKTGNISSADDYMYMELFQ